LRVFLFCIMINYMDERKIFEQKSDKYEKAHKLAETITEEFLERYSLDGDRKETTVGEKFDNGMDFWNYRMFINNKGEKPKSKEALIFIFEEVINTIYRQSIENGPERDGSYSGVDNLNEAYKFFVLNDDTVHKGIVNMIKVSIERYLEKGFEKLNEKPEILPDFRGFNKKK